METSEIRRRKARERGGIWEIIVFINLWIVVAGYEWLCRLNASVGLADYP